MRRRRRKRRWLLVIAALLLCLVGIGGVVWLSHAPFLRITAVEVLDASSVATSTIASYVEQEISGAYLFAFARSNIFLYPRQGIAQGLLQRYPAFRAVEVRAKDFHTITVKVAERKPVALWCGNAPQTAGSCLFLDEESYAYAPAPTFSSGVYTSYYGALSSSTPPVYLQTAQFQSLAALVVTLLQKKSTDTVVSVAVDEHGDVRVRFGSGFTLLFPITDNGGDVFERFSLALTAAPFAGKALTDFEYLDLRFGDKLYYKQR